MISRLTRSFFGSFISFLASSSPYRSVRIRRRRDRMISVIRFGICLSWHPLRLEDSAPPPQSSAARTIGLRVAGEGFSSVLSGEDQPSADEHHVRFEAGVIEVRLIGPVVQDDEVGFVTLRDSAKVLVPLHRERSIGCVASKSVVE